MVSRGMVNMWLGSVLIADIYVLKYISDRYRFHMRIFVQIWLIAVWYMCNVLFLTLFFISRFSCTICVLLCALCVSKENHNNSNASVVFCEGSRQVATGPNQKYFSICSDNGLSPGRWLVLLMQICVTRPQWVNRVKIPRPVVNNNKTMRYGTGTKTQACSL